MQKQYAMAIIVHKEVALKKETATLAIPPITLRGIFAGALPLLLGGMFFAVSHIRVI
jgi:hypothetical protein